MTLVVAVSPHLDDVAFSCGGLLAAAVRGGHTVRVVTVFTASVPPPLPPFALSTQLDKGLSADVDYLAIRREEDTDALAALGVHEVRWLGLSEAPHRGYLSAADLFAGVHDDDVLDDLPGLLLPHLQGAGVVLGPQGLGNHADHLQVGRALRGRVTASYRDTPYALRLPVAAAPPTGCVESAVQLSAADLEAKLDACAAYRTQLGFQFGGSGPMREALTAFAAAEAARLGVDGYAEAVTSRQPA